MAGLSQVFPPVSALTMVANGVQTLSPATLNDPSIMSWGEVVPSVPEDWAGFYVMVGGFDAHATMAVVATGAPAVEQTIAVIPLRPAAQSGSNNLDSTFYVPIPVPAGTRLSLTLVGMTTVTVPARIVGVRATGFPASSGLTRLDSGPYLLENSYPDTHRGVEMPIPTANNVKTAWTELSIAGANSTTGNILQGSALAHQYEFLGIVFETETAATSNYPGLAFDLAYGAAGAEVAFVEDMFTVFRAGTQNSGNGRFPLWFPWGRPAGDRISMRFRISDITQIIKFRPVLLGLR